MADHVLHRKREEIKRWLHAGIYRDANNIVRNIWFAYQKKKSGVLQILYANDRNGTRHGHHGAGLMKVDLITWNECYLRKWKKYLNDRGSWLYCQKSKGTKQRREALIAAYKDRGFHDPHPDGINSGSIGPLVNVMHAPDKSSGKGFDNWNVEDDDNDEDPAQPSGEDKHVFIPRTKIPQSISGIRSDLWKQVDRKAINAARKFFEGDLVVDTIFPKYHKKQIDIVESIFLELGWRVNRRAVEGAFEEICEHGKGSILQTRSWQADPPIHFDKFKGDELRKLMDEMAQEAGIYIPSDSDEIDPEDEVEDEDEDDDEEILPKRKLLPTSTAGCELRRRPDGWDSSSLPNSDEDDDGLLPTHGLKQKRARMVYLESSDDDENLILKRKKTTEEVNDDSYFEDMSEMPRAIKESEQLAKIRANSEDDAQSEISAGPSFRRIDRRRPVLPFKHWPSYSMSKGKGKAIQGVSKHYTGPDIMIDEDISTLRSAASSKSQNSGPTRAISEKLRASVRSITDRDSVFPSIELDSPLDEDLKIPGQKFLTDPDVEILEKRRSLVGESSATQTSARHVSNSTEGRTAREPPFEIPKSSVDGYSTNITQDILMKSSTKIPANNLSDRSALPYPAVVQGTQMLEIGVPRTEAIDLTIDIGIDLTVESSTPVAETSNLISRTPRIPGFVIDLTGDDNDSDDDLMIDEERSLPKGIKNEPKIEIIE